MIDEERLLKMEKTKKKNNKQNDITYHQKLMIISENFESPGLAILFMVSLETP